MLLQLQVPRWRSCYGDDISQWTVAKTGETRRYTATAPTAYALTAVSLAAPTHARMHPCACARKSGAGDERPRESGDL